MNEEKALPLFIKELDGVVKSMTEDDPSLAFELIFVDDGSTDATLQVMKDIAAEQHLIDISYLSFSRNFGKEAALYAGLAQSKGDYVATMDADLQDPPKLLPIMYEILQNDSDIDNVATRRVTRKGEPPIRSFFARTFYRLINKISKTEIVDGARDFRLMKRSMVDAVISLGEYNRFSKGIFSWVGFKTHWMEYENVNRSAGESAWNFFSLFLYSIDGIAAFSTAPLYLASVTGVIICLLACIFLIIIVARAILFGDPVSGWPSMMSTILLLGGIQLLCLGIIGLYLEKTYLETKNRPLYIIRDSNVEQ